LTFVFVALEALLIHWALFHPQRAMTVAWTALRSARVANHTTARLRPGLDFLQYKPVEIYGMGQPVPDLSPLVSDPCSALGRFRIATARHSMGEVLDRHRAAAGKLWPGCSIATSVAGWSRKRSCGEVGRAGRLRENRRRASSPRFYRLNGPSGGRACGAGSRAARRGFVPPRVQKEAAQGLRCARHPPGAISELLRL